jgi:drug/metabolite transporter (DMT)-like permease
VTSTIASPWLGERVRPLQWVGLALGLLGVYLIVRDRSAIGSATPFAWLASAVALFGITVGTLYQKRFGGGIDWRPALCVQYAAAGLLFALGRLSSKLALSTGRRSFCSQLAGSFWFCRSARSGCFTS